DAKGHGPTTPTRRGAKPRPAGPRALERSSRSPARPDAATDVHPGPPTRTSVRARAYPHVSPDRPAHTRCAGALRLPAGPWEYGIPLDPFPGPSPQRLASGTAGQMTRLVLPRPILVRERHQEEPAHPQIDEAEVHVFGDGPAAGDQLQEPVLDRIGHRVGEGVVLEDVHPLVRDQPRLLQRGPLLSVADRYRPEQLEPSATPRRVPQEPIAGPEDRRARQERLAPVDPQLVVPDQDAEEDRPTQVQPRPNPRAVRHRHPVDHDRADREEQPAQQAAAFTGVPDQE